MSYRLFLLPSSIYVSKNSSERPVPLDDFPFQIISLVNENPEKTVIITQSKTRVAIQCPKATVFERNWLGDTKQAIYAFIKEKKPTMIVLDNCFHENNCFFLDKMMEIKNQQGFNLVNILHIQTVLDLPELAKMSEAQQVDFPIHCVNFGIQKFLDFIPKFRFYDQTNIPPFVKTGDKEHEINLISAKMAKKQLDEFELKQTIKPYYIKNKTPPVVSINKTEFHFYKLLLASLNTLVDMELFHGFLTEIIEEKRNYDTEFTNSPLCIPLLNLDYITQFHNSQRFSESETLTPAMKNNYIRQIKPEINTLLKNDPILLEKICGFFVV